MHLSGNPAVKRLTEDNSLKKCVQALLFGATAVALALVYLYIQNCFSSCRGRKVAKKKATRKMLTKHKGGKLLNRSANCGAAEGTQPQLVMVAYGGGAAAGHCTVHRLRLSFVTITSLPTAAHWAHSSDLSSHLTCYGDQARNAI